MTSVLIILASLSYGLIGMITVEATRRHTPGISPFTVFAIVVAWPMYITLTIAEVAVAFITYFLDKDQ